jgi:beta-galactosidase
MFNSEFWAGWFDHWGGPHAHTSTETQAANLKWILDQGASVSIYMFHGGTDFGWMNGANSSDAKPNMYEPDVTSYDYDSALDESGRPTAKFFAFRDIIAKATGVTPPAVPEVAAPIAIAPFKLTEAASLWDNLPKPVASAMPLTMEDLGQSYGFILYRAKALIQGKAATLALGGPHDYASVYFDGKLAGTIDRRLGESGLSVPQADAPYTTKLLRVDILVENTGRINYSKQLRQERKGIGQFVSVNGDPVSSWQIYSLPMTDPSKVAFRKAECSGPCFYRGTFVVEKPGDTFLDTSNLGKGQLWVNGHALGRFWKIGPQKTLYVPGVWLKKGANEVVVFDVDGKPAATMEGLAKAELGE